jgi:hypothetical protein
LAADETSPGPSPGRRNVRRDRRRGGLWQHGQQRSGRDDGRLDGQELPLRPEDDRDQSRRHRHLDEQHNFTHTVKVDGQGDHKVGRGDSVAITLDKPGRYDYVCTLHSHDMHGTVIVT